MDTLIKSLPKKQPKKNEEYYFNVVSMDTPSEGNVCTKVQVAAAKAKGWTPYCRYFDSILRWKKYEGSNL